MRRPKNTSIDRVSVERRLTGYDELRNFLGMHLGFVGYISTDQLLFHRRRVGGGVRAAFTLAPDRSPRAPHCRSQPALALESASARHPVRSESKFAAEAHRYVLRVGSRDLAMPPQECPLDQARSSLVRSLSSSRISGPPAPCLLFRQLEEQAR